MTIIDELSVNPADQKVKAALTVLYLNDGEYIVAYVPSCNLSGYGKTREQARLMLDVAIDDMLDILSANPSLVSNRYLQKLGWWIE